MEGKRCNYRELKKIDDKANVPERNTGGRSKSGNVSLAKSTNLLENAINANDYRSCSGVLTTMLLSHSKLIAES